MRLGLLTEGTTKNTSFDYMAEGHMESHWAGMEYFGWKAESLVPPFVITQTRTNRPYKGVRLEFTLPITHTARR